jgi:hypothetical protein
VNAAKNGVTLALGDNVTCTIVNTDNTPQLKLVKIVNGGTKVADDWTLSAATSASGFMNRNFANAGGSGVFKDVYAGKSYALSESVIGGYTASAWVCTGGGTQSGSSITLALGEQVTCTITNTRDQGSIKVIKYHDLDANGSKAAAEPQLQGWTFWLDDGDGIQEITEPTATTNASGEATFSNLDTTVSGSPTYKVCEVQQSGWVNSDPGGNGAPCKSGIVVTKNGTTTVQFGNYQRIKIQVNKTVDGGPVPAGKTFTFTIRKGAGPVSGDGTIIATGSMLGPDSQIQSAEWVVASGQQYPLNPGDYQLCEVIVNGYSPGWTQSATYGAGLGQWFQPGVASGSGYQEVANLNVCLNFHVTSGDGGATQTVTFNVDNVSKGLSRTIGFWKNWNNCTGGGQFDMLGTVLNGGTGPGGIVYAGADDSNGNGQKDIRIGNIYVEGANACAIAVDILDKRPVGNPALVGDQAKAASDPAVNGAAQLLAYELNQLLNPNGSGAASCQAKAAQAADLMQRILASNAVNFTLGYQPAKKADAKIGANLNYLSEILDDYNNNTIGGCGTPIQVPNPGSPNPLPPSFDT